MVGRFTAAMAMPKDDDDKWFISVLTIPGCAACNRLKKDWLKSDRLLALADPNSTKDSFAHFGYYDMGKNSRQKQRELFSGVKVAAYPTILVQPPINGVFGSAKHLVFRDTYKGDPEKLADDMIVAMWLFIEANETKNVELPNSVVVKSDSGFSSDKEDAVTWPRPRPRPAPAPAPCPVPTPNPDDVVTPDKPDRLPRPDKPDDGKLFPPREVFQKRVKVEVDKALVAERARWDRERKEREWFPRIKAWFSGFMGAIRLAMFVIGTIVILVLLMLCLGLAKMAIGQFSVLDGLSGLWSFAFKKKDVVAEAKVAAMVAPAPAQSPLVSMMEELKSEISATRAEVAVANAKREETEGKVLDVSKEMAGVSQSLADAVEGTE